MVAGRLSLLLIASLLVGGPAHGAASPETAQARQLWAQSPHGRMLERILPPAIEPRQLPEPQSDGARLTTRYCVQCHHLPNPQMHSAERWQPIVERMVWRMQGKGNMGALMKEMMAQVEAPSENEVATLSAYLRRHAQREIDPKHPALQTSAGQIYSLACSQCHALPDPQRHTASAWPGVVKRMQGHMAWANTVVGVRELRTNPELDTAEIVRLLQRHARRGGIP
jgi:cytochrome c5